MGLEIPSQKRLAPAAEDASDLLLDLGAFGARERLRGVDRPVCLVRGLLPGGSGRGRGRLAGRWNRYRVDPLHRAMLLGAGIAAHRQIPKFASRQARSDGDYRPKNASRRSILGIRLDALPLRKSLAKEHAMPR